MKPETKNQTTSTNRLNGEQIPIKGTPEERVSITPLKERVLIVAIKGLTPLKVLRFSEKAKNEMMKNQQAGSQAKSKKIRTARDFNADYEQAKFICKDPKNLEWLGINATGIRNACIETCRMCGFVMTKARMSIFVLEDGFDKFDRTPLVRIEGDPEISIDPVRNANGGADLRARVCFPEWKAYPMIRFDEDQFSVSDVLNLMVRVGKQNGLGEGRPNSSNGNGCGNGIFEVLHDECKLIKKE